MQFLCHFAFPFFKFWIISSPSCNSFKCTKIPTRNETSFFWNSSMLFLKLTYPQTVLFLLREGSSRGALPGNTDVFKTSSERLKKVATSYDQTRRRHDFWKKTSDLRHLEDVWFTMSSRRLVYDVLKTSDLSRLEDVEFETSWKRLIYDVFRMSDLRRLEDVRFMSSWRSPIYDVFKTSDLQHLEDVWFMISWRGLFCTAWNVQKILSAPV